MNDFCKETVFSKGTSFPRPSRCSRKATKDGFCHQHHPDTKTLRQAKADERHKQRQQNSIYSQLARLEKINTDQSRIMSEIVEALEAMLHESDTPEAFERAYANGKAVLAKYKESKQ